MNQIFSRASLVAAALLPLAGPAPAQPPSPETPVWNVSYTRVFPGKLDQYLEQVRLILLPVLEEDKRRGGILDYKVLQKKNNNGADDWNIELIVIFKNYAHLDGYMARWEAIGKQILGDVTEADRNALRVDTGTDFLEELKLK